MIERRTIIALVGVTMFFLFLWSFVDNTLCTSGCGSHLMEWTGILMYRLFGLWGTRALLLAQSGYYCWYALTEAD